MSDLWIIRGLLIAGLLLGAFLVTYLFRRDWKEAEAARLKAEAAFKARADSISAWQVLGARVCPDCGCADDVTCEECRRLWHLRKACREAVALAKGEAGAAE